MGPRAAPPGAGFEPESPTTRFQRDRGLGYDDEVRGSGTTFREWLRAGRLAGQAAPRSSGVAVYSILKMAGKKWEDPVIAAYKRDVDRTLLKKNLRLTPEERILAVMELQRLAEEVRRAGREARRGR